MSEASRTVRPIGSARRRVDRVGTRCLFVSSVIPLAVVIVMIVALAARARPILSTGSVWTLLTGHVWQPFARKFGFLPFISGTLWVTAGAMLIATPPSLLVAFYLAEYAKESTRSMMKPVLDLLAGIPSVVYGVWGMVAIVPWVEKTAGPFLRRTFPSVPLFETTNPTGYGILAGSLCRHVRLARIDHGRGALHHPGRADRARLRLGLRPLR